MVLVIDTTGLPQHVQDRIACGWTTPEYTVPRRRPIRNNRAHRLACQAKAQGKHDRARRLFRRAYGLDR
jgi:hypothetical protein